MIFASPELREQFYTRLDPPARRCAEALEAAHLPSLRPLLVTAVIKPSPTHDGRSVDLAYRFRHRPNPVVFGHSLRLTDKRLLHAFLKSRAWPCAIVVENDHYHVTTALAPGIYLYDNPRPQYRAESQLLTSPSFARAYGDFARLIRL